MASLTERVTGVVGEPAGPEGARAPMGWLRDMIRRHGAQPADVSMRHAFLGTMASLLLVGVIFSFVYGSVRADLLFSNHEGKLTPLQYSDAPNTSSEAVVNWTAFALSEILTYNFNNIQERLSGASRYFTPEGWEAFREALARDDRIQGVVSGRQFVSTVLAGSPVVLREGEIEGVYTWTVRAPLLINVYTGTSGFSTGGTATVQIERIPTRKSASGYAFGIARITH